MARGVFAATSGAPAAPYTSRIPCIYQAQSVGHCSVPPPRTGYIPIIISSGARAYILSPLQTYVFRRARDEYAFVPPCATTHCSSSGTTALTILYRARACAYAYMYIILYNNTF